MPTENRVVIIITGLYYTANTRAYTSVRVWHCSYLIIFLEDRFGSSYILVQESPYKCS